MIIGSDAHSVGFFLLFLGIQINEMLQIIRTNSDHPDFKALIVSLDRYLAVMDGDEHAFYDQYNKVDAISEVTVAYFDGKPAGCGAIKKYSETESEVKRMYVSPEFRRHGIATAILNALENWAKALGFSYCILETGKKQVEAVNLYPKCGYVIVPNYGQYAQMENSLCMKKKL